MTNNSGKWMISTRYVRDWDQALTYTIR